MSGLRKLLRPDPVAGFLVLTTDDWCPSLDREGVGLQRADAPVMRCDCNDCCVLSPSERLTEARQDYASGGFVRVRLRSATEKAPARVSVWGGDDTGLEREFTSEEEARRFVCRLPVFLTYDWLYAVGFQYA